MLWAEANVASSLERLQVGNQIADLSGAERRRGSVLVTTAARRRGKPIGERRGAAVVQKGRTKSETAQRWDLEGATRADIYGHVARERGAAVTGSASHGRVPKE